MDNDSRRMDLVQENLATTVVEAISRIDSSDKGREPPPLWEK